MFEALDTNQITTGGTHWGRAKVGPYSVVLALEGIGVVVPRVVGNDLRPKFYWVPLAELEGEYPGSYMVESFLTETTRCTVSTVHHDEKGERWINTFLCVGDVNDPPFDVNGVAHVRSLQINVMDPRDSWTDIEPVKDLAAGVPLELVQIAYP
jgi:hypothetical protein